MNLNTKTIIIATSTALLLSACGGGKKETKPATATVPKCDTNTYTALNKNDTITALQDGTEVIVRHHQDGTRETCIKTGDVKVN